MKNKKVKNYLKEKKMSKYQFKLNGKVVSAKELYELDLSYALESFMVLDGNALILDDLLKGEVIELDDFTSDNSVDRLQLVEVK